MRVYQSNLALKISSHYEELHKEKVDFWSSSFFHVFISGLAGWWANIKVSEKSLLGLASVKFYEKYRQHPTPPPDNSEKELQN